MIATQRTIGRILRQIGEQAKDDFEEILQKLKTDAYNDLVTFSAADTGFLLSNWDVAIGEAPGGALVNPGGSFSRKPVPNISIKFDDKITIYNNTEYAMHLETGTAEMRAQPMIEPTYQRLYAQAGALADVLSRERSNV